MSRFMAIFDSIQPMLRRLQRQLCLLLEARLLLARRDALSFTSCTSRGVHCFEVRGRRGAWVLLSFGHQCGVL
jgi:hypothetical protein